jgi:hypothetical protein
MGELLGLPEWLLAGLFVVAALTIWFGIAWRNTTKRVHETAARRANPTETEFMQMMRADVSEDASAFLWKSALPYLECFRPKLTPHPDDDLVQHLPIDDDNFGMDWPREWAELKGFHESNMADWPEGWPVTIRNYGRWLDMAPAASSPRT